MIENSLLERLQALLAEFRNDVLEEVAEMVEDIEEGTDGAAIAESIRALKEE